MLKAIKILLVLLLVAVIIIFAWGYAPDRDVTELRAEYGGEPSLLLPLPNGQTVHVRDEGPRQGPVLLMIHGSSSSLHTWQGWVDALKDQYRIVRLDLPGHGLTGPHISDDYSTKAFVDTAATVMEQLGIKKYTVIGNSMGGYVAWNMALAYPQEVTGLVLVDASGAPQIAPDSLPIGFRLAQSDAVRPILQWFTPRMIIDRSLRQSVAEPEKVTQAQVDRYYDLLRHPGNREATLLRGEAPQIEATPEMLGSITVPTLIMWGAKDTLIPVKAAEWFATHIPRSSTIIYRDLGHIPMEEAPQRTAQDLRQWLKDVALDTLAPSGPVILPPVSAEIFLEPSQVSPSSDAEKPAVAEDGHLHQPDNWKRRGLGLQPRCMRPACPADI
jgi:pimeloyl-ACP methyl ester carboxylesterase